MYCNFFSVKNICLTLILFFLLMFYFSLFTPNFNQIPVPEQNAHFSLSFFKKGLCDNNKDIFVLTKCFNIL